MDRGSSLSETVRLPSISIPFAYSLRMGHKIKKINQRLELDTIVSDFKRFNLGVGDQVQIPQKRPCVVQRLRDTHSFMTFKVLGRDQDKENVIHLLLQPRGVENIPITSILGNLE
ncbi:hypothetical protein V6N11_080030 [Hibiscus sabdariffa]|uniref:Uncharacterized protein n=1 Tax=Hibiscus sabdariffa TaxID=183260 RepID=A0ABR2RXB5_9ROSI